MGCCEPNNTDDEYDHDNDDNHDGDKDDDDDSNHSIYKGDISGPAVSTEDLVSMALDYHRKIIWMQQQHASQGRDNSSGPD